MTSNPRSEAESVAAQYGLARVLAGQVARDAHAAEDLAQEALIIAISRADAAASSSRRWWAKLVRNLGLTQMRSEQRRARREREAARPEAAPSTVELALREADRKTLIDAVAELPEPWRETIRARFLDGLSAREVARLLGCPESTIATRTAEGLRRLRVALGAHDDRDSSSWLASIFLPFRRSRGLAAPASSTGALVMSGSTKLFLSVGALVALILVVSQLDLDSSPISAREVARAEAQPQVLAEQVARPPANIETARTDAVEADAAEQPLAFVHPPYESFSYPPVEVHGRVLDLAGHTVPAVDIARQSYGRSAILGGSRGSHGAGSSKATVETTTDGRGEFVLELAPPFSLRVESERYATVYGASVAHDHEDEPVLIVVAPRVELCGHVFNEAGEGVADASVALAVEGRPLKLAGNLLDSSSLLTWHVKTDEHGVFKFAEAPDLEGARLTVIASGYQTLWLDFPAGGDADLRVTLVRARAEPKTLTGRVVLPGGEPAPNAWISYGKFAKRPDAQGYFSFEFDHEHAWQAVPTDEPFEVVATQQGYLPARANSPSIEEAEASGERKELLLVLGGPPLSLRGRVIDDQGLPLAGLAVRVVETSPFGLVPNERFGWAQMKTIEEMNGRAETITDSQGVFELTGLLEREYCVEVLQRPSLLCATSEPVIAGSEDVEIVLDTSTASSLAGRVVDAVGAPIPDVLISVSREWPGSLEIGAGATTDAEGYFLIEGATSTPDFLRIEGEQVVTELFHELPEDADMQALELVVARRCWLQVDFGEASARADSLRVIDEAGEAIEMIAMEGNSIGVRPTIPIGRGLSDVFAISEAARTVILMRGEEEVARYTIRPVQAEVFLLRL